MDLDDLMGLVLVLVRVAGMMAFLPLLGEGNAPRVVKGLAALVISVALLPVVDVTLPLGVWQPVQFLLFVAAEVCFGAFTGFCALMIFKTMKMAGEVMGQQMGMAMAATADPVAGSRSTLVGTFCETVGTLTFLAVGGHRWMLRAVGESFVQWPLGAFLSTDFMLRVSAATVMRSFTMAIQLASPLLLLAFVISVSMAVVARLVPQMNLMIVAFPLRIGAGLFGLLVFLPVLVRYSGNVSQLVVRVMLGISSG